MCLKPLFLILRLGAPDFHNSFMKYCNKKGFTLAEVLISMTVLALTFSAAVGLLLSSIQVNRANTNDFIAYGLAQEGLEAMRNIRDSHRMQNFSWTGTDGKWKNAGNYFGDVISSGVPHYYRLSYNLDYSASAGTVYDEAIAVRYNPWVFEELGSDFSVADDLGTDIFSRYIEIRPLFISGGIVDPNRAKVFSVVFWNEKGRERKIALDTVLTTWKRGVL